MIKIYYNNQDLLTKMMMLTSKSWMLMIKNYKTLKNDFQNKILMILTILMSKTLNYQITYWMNKIYYLNKTILKNTYKHQNKKILVIQCRSQIQKNKTLDKILNSCKT